MIEKCNLKAKLPITLVPIVYLPAPNGLAAKESNQKVIA